MDSELIKMRRYMLHHRIVTYAIVLFLTLMTFILISISRQIENEQALIDSQASHRPSHVTNQGTCPANGMPHRLTYNGASSCYFGQYRSVSVRCTDGARAQIINSSAVGSFSVCADKSVLEAAAKSRCGCTGGGQGGPNNPLTPTAGAGTPGQPAPTFPSGGIDPLPSNGPTGFTSRVPSATPFPGVTGRLIAPIAPQCPRGLKTFSVEWECATLHTQPATFASATYACVNKKKGSIPTVGTCKTYAYLQAQAETACKDDPRCIIKAYPSPTPVPTFGPPTE